MTFAPRALLLLSVLVAAACSPVIEPSATPSRSTVPTAGATTTTPSADVSSAPTATSASNASVALGGEWFCYGYQAGVGTNAVNVAGVIGGNSFLGSFLIEDGSTYASFYGADHGTYGLDTATSGISFGSGAMFGLAGTYGAGSDHDLIDLHGFGNGRETPYVVSMICQHG